MSKHLLFGGPAPTGAVDSGWAKRQEALGLSTDTSIPPTTAASSSAQQAGLSKRDAIWEAKRQRRLQQAQATQEGESNVPLNAVVDRSPIDRSIPPPTFEPVAHSTNPAFQPTLTVSPIGANSASQPVVPAVTQPSGWENSSPPPFRAANASTQHHVNFSDERRGSVEVAALASAFDRTAHTKTVESKPPEHVSKHAAAEEYAKELERQMTAKLQAEQQRKQQERMLAQQSSGIADIIGSASSHHKIMKQVHQRSRSKERAAELSAVPAPAARMDALDRLQRHQSEDVHRIRPVSATDRYEQSQIDTNHHKSLYQEGRRFSGGQSVLGSAGLHAVDGMSGDSRRRIHSAHHPSPHTSHTSAPWDKAPVQSAEKPDEAAAKEAYAEELRRQMAEREDRKRREKAISLAPTFIPSSRHAGRREEAVTRNIYLRAVSPTPSLDAPVMHGKAPPHFPRDIYAPPTDYPPAHYAPSSAAAHHPEYHSSHQQQSDYFPAHHHAPQYPPEPYAYATQQPKSYAPQPVHAAWSNNANNVARTEWNAPSAQPSPSYFSAVRPVSPLEDPEAAHKREAQRKKDMYAAELEYQMRIAQQRKEEERMKARHDVPVEREYHFVSDRRGSMEGGWNAVNPPIVKDTYGKAQSDLRPGAEPESLAKKAKMQEEAALALEAQIQEKAQRKKEEAARRKAEEAEEEERLARERALIARRFQEEEDVKRANQEEETRKALEAQIEAKRRQRELEQAREAALLEQDEARFQRQQRELQDAYDRERSGGNDEGRKSPGIDVDHIPIGAAAKRDLFGPPPEDKPVEYSSDIVPASMQPFGQNADDTSQANFLPVTQPPMPQMPMQMLMPMQMQAYAVPPTTVAAMPAPYYMQIVQQPQVVWPPMTHLPATTAPTLMPAAYPMPTTTMAPWAAYPSNSNINSNDMARPSTSLTTRLKLDAHEEEISKLRAELVAVKHKANDGAITNAMVNAYNHGNSNNNYSQDYHRGQQIQSPKTPRQVFDESFHDHHHQQQQQQHMPRRGVRLEFAESPQSYRQRRPITHVAAPEDDLLISMKGESRFLMPGNSSAGIGEIITAEDEAGADVLLSTTGEGGALQGSSTFEPGTDDGSSSHKHANELLLAEQAHNDIRGGTHAPSGSSSQLSVLAASSGAHGPSERTASPVVGKRNSEEDVIAAIDGLLQSTVLDRRSALTDAAYAAKQQGSIGIGNDSLSPPAQAAADDSMLDTTFAPMDFMRISSMVPTTFPRAPAPNYPPMAPAAATTTTSSRSALPPTHHAAHTRPYSSQSGVSATPSELHPSMQLTRQLLQQQQQTRTQRSHAHASRGVTWGLTSKTNKSVSDYDEYSSTDERSNTRRRSPDRQRKGSTSHHRRRSSRYSDDDGEDSGDYTDNASSSGSASSYHRSGDRRRSKRHNSHRRASSRSVESYSPSPEEDRDRDRRRRRHRSHSRKHDTRYASRHRSEDTYQAEKSPLQQPSPAAAPPASHHEHTGPVVLQRGTPDLVRREMGKHAGKLASESRWM